MFEANKDKNSVMGTWRAVRWFYEEKVGSKRAENTSQELSVLIEAEKYLLGIIHGKRSDWELRKMLNEWRFWLVNLTWLYEVGTTETSAWKTRLHIHRWHVEGTVRAREGKERNSTQTKTDKGVKRDKAWLPAVPRRAKRGQEQRRIKSNNDNGKARWSRSWWRGSLRRGEGVKDSN